MKKIKIKLKQKWCLKVNLKVRFNNSEANFKKGKKSNNLKQKETFCNKYTGYYWQDDLIEPTADSVNLSAALASATLSKKREDRVINAELHRDQGPPWGEHNVSDWVKTPVSPPKDFRGRPTIQPMVGVIAYTQYINT